MKASEPWRVSGLLLIALLTVLGKQASAETVNIEHLVDAAGGQVESLTVVVERQSDGQMWLSNPERAQQRYSPASTSKVPHTLIALERGLATPETVFAWDGIHRSVRAWNQDHTLETAFKTSAVWVYQEIVRRAGQRAMSEELAGFEYGNMDVGSIDQLTTYWLDDTLQISAVEQIGFLSKFVREQFPLSAPTYAAARDIMVSDANGKWVVRSKTGWRYSKNEMDIGWFVGWLECSSETHVFALNIDMPDTRFLSKRKEIAYSILEGIGAFDCN